MGFDHGAPRRPVNLNLNSDLVDRCRAGVDNFSAYVESLLEADLKRREAEDDAERQRTERAIDAFSELYRQHGSLSEEFQSI